ncbi:MAG: hypothetical protein WCQ57_01435 [Verrucomicrobiota bacterium]
MAIFNWRQKLIAWLQAAEVKTPVDRNGKAPINLPYVFIIGFNKTATTALHHFFQANGFPSIHWDDNRLAATMLTNCLSDRPILSGYDEKYRVFSDMISQTFRLRFEANSFFRILDTDYPGSYFIFNNRPTEAWLVSRWKKPCQRYNTTNVELEMRILNTNDPKKILEKWKHEKEAFEREVREYFSGNERFLEFDISDPAAPQKISALLAMELDVSHWAQHKTNRGSEELLRRVKALGPCPLAEI